MAAAGLVHAPAQILLRPRVLDEGEERKSVAEIPPVAPGSCLENALWIPSDDEDEDDEARSDNGSPSLNEILTSAPGALVTPLNSEASADDPPHQFDTEDSGNYDAVGGPLETQEASEVNVNAITMAEDGDKDEDQGEEEQDGEEQDGEEEAARLLPGEISPVENHAWDGVSGVRRAGIAGMSRSASLQAVASRAKLANSFRPEGAGEALESPALAFERDDLSSHSQANARDMKPPTPQRPTLPSVSPRASPDISTLKRRSGDEDETDEAYETEETDTSDGQDRGETSDTDCNSPVSPLSSSGRSWVEPSCSAGSQARRAGMTPHQPRLLHQDSHSGDARPARVADKVDGPLYTEAARPQRKRRKISQIPRRVSEHPASDDSSKGATSPTYTQAAYQEWPLQDVSLKQVTEGGRTVFQLQFAWDSGCGGHGTSARKLRVSRTKFTNDEDSLLVKLKEKNLPWLKIHRVFTNEFPGRSLGALQVRYCTKLKKKSKAMTGPPSTRSFGRRA